MNLIIWIVIVAVPIVAGMIMSGGLGQFIDPPSAFITILPAIGALLVGFKGYFNIIYHISLEKGCRSPDSS